MPTLNHGTRITVKTVDRYSYLGREHHPSKADIGRAGTVLSHELDVSEDDTGEPVTFYACRMDGGDLLELADFEIFAHELDGAQNDYR